MTRLIALLLFFTMFSGCSKPEQANFEVVWNKENSSSTGTNVYTQKYSVQRGVQAGFFPSQPGQVVLLSNEYFKVTSRGIFNSDGSTYCEVSCTFDELTTTEKIEVTSGSATSFNFENGMNVVISLTKKEG